MTSINPDDEYFDRIKLLKFLLCIVIQIKIYSKVRPELTHFKTHLHPAKAKFALMFVVFFFGLDQYSIFGKNIYLYINKRFFQVEYSIIGQMPKNKLYCFSINNNAKFID